MKKNLSTIMRICISLALIALLLYIMRGAYGEILARLKDTDIRIFALGFLVFIGAVVMSSLRLKLIVEAQGMPVSFRESLSLNFIGYFFNNFLPTTIGGDVVKAYYLSRKTSASMISFTSVFIDRAIGLFTMVFMAFIALLVSGNQGVDDAIRYVIYAITALAAIAVVFVTNKNFARPFSAALVVLRPIEEKLRKAYNAIYRYQRHRALMLQSFLISIVSQLFFFFSMGIIASSIGARITARDILLRAPIVSMVSLLPSINGLGLRESSTVLFFGPLIGKGNAFAVSVLWLFILLMTSVIGGIIYAVSPQFRVKIPEVNGNSLRRSV